MKIKIGTDILREIEEHALRDYPNECCGMLFGKREQDDTLKVLEIRKTLNVVAGSAWKEYEISPLEIYNAESEYKKKGLKLIGFYHSHPDKKAVPSEKDKKGMLPDMAYLIVSVTKTQCLDMEAYEKLNFQDNKYEIENYI